MTYHLSSAGIHLTKGNVQIKVRHFYLICRVRREHQFWAHKKEHVPTANGTQTLQMPFMLPNADCGYSIKCVFDLCIVLNIIFCRTLCIVFFSQNSNNEGNICKRTKPAF